MKTIFSLLTLVSLSFFSFAQTSISISSSGFSPASIPFNGSTFSDFAPNSKLMEAAQNPNNGYLGKMNGITHGVGNITSFALEIPSAKETIFGLQNGTWRFGLQIMRLEDFNYFIINERRVNGVDTLTYSSSGKKEIIDSIYTKTYHFKHTTRSIGVDAAYLLSTNIERRFAFRFGAGIVLQKGISGTTEVINLNTSEIAYIKENGAEERNFDYDDTKGSENKETYRNKAGYGFQFYVPLNVDFRIANKGFFQKMHILIGYHLITQVYNLPDNGWYANQFNAFNSGLRFYLN